MLHLHDITLPKIDFNSFAHFCLKIIELNYLNFGKKEAFLHNKLGVRKEANPYRGKQVCDPLKVKACQILGSNLFKQTDIS